LKNKHASGDSCVLAHYAVLLGELLPLFQNILHLQIQAAQENQYTIILWRTRSYLHNTAYCLSILGSFLLPLWECQISRL